MLNRRLSEELSAINQYVVHHAMLELWGYDKLAAVLMGHARKEMEHAELLIARILFLDGAPVVDAKPDVKVGYTVPEMLNNDFAAEAAAVRLYNATLAKAVVEGDGGTRELAERILVDEEAHKRYLEGLKTRLNDMGLQNFLSTI